MLDDEMLKLLIELAKLLGENEKNQIAGNDSALINKKYIG